MDQTPNTQQQVSLGEHHKSPVVAIFVGVILIAVAVIAYWMMRQQAKIQSPADESTSVPRRAAGADTSAAIEADLDSVNVDATDLDAEFRDVDSSLDQL